MIGKDTKSFFSFESELIFFRINHTMAKLIFIPLQSQTKKYYNREFT